MDPVTLLQAEVKSAFGGVNKFVEWSFATAPGNSASASRPLAFAVSRPSLTLFISCRRVRQPTPVVHVQAHLPLARARPRPDLVLLDLDRRRLARALHLLRPGLIPHQSARAHLVRRARLPPRRRRAPPTVPGQARRRAPREEGRPRAARAREARGAGEGRRQEHAEGWDGAVRGARASRQVRPLPSLDR